MMEKASLNHTADIKIIKLPASMKNSAQFKGPSASWHPSVWHISYSVCCASLTTVQLTSTQALSPSIIVVFGFIFLRIPKTFNSKNRRAKMMSCNKLYNRWNIAQVCMCFCSIFCSSGLIASFEANASWHPQITCSSLQRHMKTHQNCTTCALRSLLDI